MSQPFLISRSHTELWASKKLNYSLAQIPLPDCRLTGVEPKSLIKTSRLEMEWLRLMNKSGDSVRGSAFS